MLKISTELADVIVGLPRELPLPFPGTAVLVLIGKLSDPLAYATASGAPVDCLVGHPVTPGVPDNTVLIGIVTGDRPAPSVPKCTGDGTVLEIGYGCAPGNVHATFRAFSIDVLKDAPYVRIPGANVEFARTPHDLLSNRSMGFAPYNPHMETNLVGGVYIPVVTDVEKYPHYYINLFGETVKLSSRSASGDDMGVGLIYYPKSGPAVNLGKLKDLLFTSPESLKNDIVLYSDLATAEKYCSMTDYYAGLDELAKAETLILDEEIRQLKHTLAKEEGEDKRTVLKAKTEYETSSLGRKDVAESSNHARVMGVGLVATAGAAIGLATKLGITTSYGGLIMASMPTTAGVALLTTVFAIGKYTNVDFGEFLKSLVTFTGDVIGSVLTGVGNVLKYASSVLGGIARGGGRILCGLVGSIFN